MNINATLIIQMIVFGILVWFTMEVHLAADHQGDRRARRRRSPKACRPPTRPDRAAERPRARPRADRQCGPRPGQEDRRPGAQARGRDRRRGQVDRPRRGRRASSPPRPRRRAGKVPRPRRAAQGRGQPGRGRRFASAAARDRPQGARRPDRATGPRDRGRQGLTAAAPEQGTWSNDAWPRSPRLRDPTPRRLSRHARRQGHARRAGRAGSEPRARSSLSDELQAFAEQPRRRPPAGQGAGRQRLRRCARRARPIAARPARRERPDRLRCRRSPCSSTSCQGRAPERRRRRGAFLPPSSATPSASDSPAPCSARLHRDVRLHCTVDPALIGGAVVRSGDVLLDASRANAPAARPN